VWRGERRRRPRRPGARRDEPAASRRGRPVTVAFSAVVLTARGIQRTRRHQSWPFLIWLGIYATSFVPVMLLAKPPLVIGHFRVGLPLSRL